MKVNDRLIEDLIFNRFQLTSRFTQDSPVYPDVWLDYYNNAANLATHRADLILVPARVRGEVRLFVSRWDNPRPEVEVTSLDIVSKMTRSGPILIALTVEP